MESALDLDLEDVNLLNRDCSDWADITPENILVVSIVLNRDTDLGTLPSNVLENFSRIQYIQRNIGTSQLDLK